ncbi:MAG: glutathione synthase [Cellvibrionaceae bacterium]|nr:glutathione synthase [Cellvibrionaceae bacterium]
MDPIEAITYSKDTTLALLLAAQELGHQLWYMELDDLLLKNGRPCANIAQLKVFDNADRWFEKGEKSLTDLSSLDVILMRKDPPFDNQFIYSTYILEAAENQGVLVVNKPQSLRDCNEKIFATSFPQCCPPLLVSRNSENLRIFHQEHGDTIFKPLDGMGGQSIFRCQPNDPNLNVILETLTQNNTCYIMAQQFIPDIKNGDKRILIVNGKAVPYCLARIPAAGETRGNLAAGGTGVAQTLSDRDRWIVAQVAPTLVKKGLMFVGLDVIGDYLTEINVTSPTCAREIDRAHDTHIGTLLIREIENILNK